MAKLNELAVDQAKAVGGVMVTWARDARIRVARLGNREHKRVLVELFKAFKEEHQREPQDSEVEVIEARALARAVLLDWENVTDDEGNATPYTAELGERLLRDPDYSDLLERVTLTATSAEMYARQSQKDSEGK